MERRVISNPINVGIIAATLMHLVACKPASSGLNDVATADRYKTGFFLPKLSAEYRYEGRSDAGDALAFAARYQVPAVQGAKYTLSRTGKGETVLLAQTKTFEPMPVISVGRDGTKYNWVMYTSSADEALYLSDIWLKFKDGETPRPFVSTDGNQSNIFTVRRPESDAGITEPMLVSWVDHLQTSSGALLYRVGNAVVAAETDTVAYDYSEVGNQVWQLRGTYRDNDVESGSVFWSADLVTYFSMTAGKAVATEWRKQDKDSMDRVGVRPLGDLQVPSVVQRIVADQDKQRTKTTDDELVAPGIKSGEADTAHVYLYPVRGRARNQLQLTGAASLAPNAAQQEADAFFDPVYAACLASRSASSCTGTVAANLALADDGVDWSAKVYQNSTDGSGRQVNHAVAFQVPYRKLPTLDFAANKGTGQSGGVNPRAYVVNGKQTPGGLQAPVSTGSHFALRHAGQDYRAVVVVPPYSTTKTLMTPGVRGSVKIDARVEQMKVLMVPVDSSGAPIAGAKQRIGLVDASQRGISRIQDEADIAEEYGMALDQLGLKDDPATGQRVATGKTDTDYMRYMQQSRSQAATARQDMLSADEQYSDMHSFTGLGKRAFGEGMGVLTKIKPVAGALSVFANKYGGRTALKLGSGLAGKKYGREIVTNFATGMAANAGQTAIDYMSAAQGKDFDPWSMAYSTAGIITTSLIPGVSEGSAAYRKAGISAAKKFTNQTVQDVSEGGVAAVKPSTSWTHNALYVGGLAADIGLDLAAKTPATALIVAGGRYAKDQVGLIAKYGAAKAAFDESARSASKATNYLVNTYANDPELIRNEKDKIISGLGTVQKSSDK